MNPHATALAILAALSLAAPALAEGEVPQPIAERAAREAELAWDLYGVLRERDGNLFFSPHSISQALAMTYAGARGETADEMAQVLHFEEGEAVHRASRGLARLLQSRAEGGGRGSDGQGFRLRVVNALWGQEDVSFRAPFLELLRETYEAPLHEVDYRADTDGARREINAWVSEQTEEKIPELIPPGVLAADTKLVLTNAVYFNAAWAMPFDEDATRPRAFHRLSGEATQAPFMHQEEHLRHGQGDGYTAVELPYEGQMISMVVIVPDAGRFAEVEAELDADRLQAISEGLEGKRVALALPRFEFRSRFRLGETLRTLGLETAFDPTVADFSGMTGGRDVCVSEVLHEGYVKTNENGTEAAAATAVVMRETAALSLGLPLVVDRPFLFVIRDASGAILFAGRVVDPGAD